MLHFAKTDFDVAQTFAVSELSESHRVELVEAFEALDLVIAVIASDAFMELPQREEVHNLREDSLTGVHKPLLEKW